MSVTRAIALVGIACALFGGFMLVRRVNTFGAQPAVTAPHR